MSMRGNEYIGTVLTVFAGLSIVALIAVLMLRESPMIGTGEFKIKQIMLRNLVIGFILICLSGCNSQAQNDGIITAIELKQDLDQLKKILESNHPQLFRFTSREQFDSLYAEAEKEFFDNMDIKDAFLPFSRIIASIGCGHTRIDLPKRYWENHSSGIFPAELLISGSKVLIKSSFAENNSLPVGAEIVSINEISIEEIVKDFRQYSSGDGFWNSRRDWLASKYFAPRLAAMFDFPDQYQITYRKDKSAPAESITIESVSSSEIPSPEREKDFDLKTDRPDKTSLLTISTFNYYNDIKGFKNYIDSAFNEINKAKSENLILDLRGNSGGDPHCSIHLFSYLIPKAIPYFAEKIGGYESYASPTPAFENRFRGELFILIDGGSFSTTGHLTSLLKYHKIGTFIGQETGGTFTCNDNSREYTLKNTGFSGSVARATFYTAVKGMSWAEGVQPDYEVLPNADDIRNEKDAALEVAFRLIREHQGE